MATKEKIYVVMEHLAEGELFDKIVRHFFTFTLSIGMRIF